MIIQIDTNMLHPFIMAYVAGAIKGQIEAGVDDGGIVNAMRSLSSKLFDAAINEVGEKLATKWFQDGYNAEK